MRALGAGSGYDAAEVHCTDAAGIWSRDVETNEFTCAVPRTDAGCDWFSVRVDRTQGRVVVKLAQRDAGCTLGF